MEEMEEMEIKEIKEYSILVLVEAETPQLAREETVGMLMTKVVGERYSLRGFSLSFTPPVKADTEEGHTLIQAMWMEYLKQNVADLQIVAEALAPHVADTDPPMEMLEDWAVRAACLRLGTITDWPIRIYHVGIGVNNTAMLDDLTHDDSLWVVCAQVG
jgi:hypothetical protein